MKVAIISWLLQVGVVRHACTYPKWWRIVSQLSWQGMNHPLPIPLILEGTGEFWSGIFYINIFYFLVFAFHKDLMEILYFPTKFLQCFFCDCCFHVTFNNFWLVGYVILSHATILGMALKDLLSVCS